MKTSQKSTILLAYGGESPEHDVSITSASNVYQAIDTERYDIVPCFIDKHGKWWRTDGITPTADRATPIQLSPGAGAVLIGDTRCAIDVILPILHGQYGEDGTIQGLARMLHVPIAGCDIDGSVLCIDKILTKQVLTFAEIPVVPYIRYERGDPLPDFELLQKALGPELFIKPAHLGSSVGVSKVGTSKEFAKGLDEALACDDQVLIEVALNVREIEVAVFGPTAHPHASVAGEVKPDREFYSYDSKYDADSKSEVQIPAQLTNVQTAEIHRIALKAFTALHCRGLARIDFFLTNSGDIFVNEVNTMPGFTNISMYPKLWEASGKPYQQLLTDLIELAKVS